MFDFLNRIDNGTLGLLAFTLPLVGGLMALALVGAILKFRQQTRTQQIENDLKHEMIAKGMSAADIERVIRASANGSPGHPPPAVAGPGVDKARLVGILVAHDMDAAGVEQVLRALGEYPDEETPAKVAAIESMVKMGMEADDVERVMRAFQRTPGATALPPVPGPTAFRE